MKGEEQVSVAILIPCDLRLARACAPFVGVVIDTKDGDDSKRICSRQIACPTCARQCWLTPDLVELQGRLPKTIRVCMVCFIRLLIETTGLAERSTPRHVEDDFPDIKIGIPRTKWAEER